MPRAAAWALAPAAADDRRERSPVGAFDVRRRAGLDTAMADAVLCERNSSCLLELGERQRSFTLALFCVRYVCVCVYSVHAAVSCLR